jgi:hypothetical protein
MLLCRILCVKETRYSSSSQLDTEGYVPKMLGESPTMDTQNAQTIIDANTEQLERFVRYYLLDNGVGVQLIEVVAKELFGQQVVVNGTVPEDVAKTPKELVSGAITDMVDVELFGGTSYNLETLLDGAASLEFIVRYARKLDPRVMPPELIPSDEVVDAALAIFHEKRATVSAE